MLYYLALGVIRALQALPLVWVAWLGRQAGGLAWLLDARHRRVAAQRFRTQERNRAYSLERLAELVREAAKPPPPIRRATRPT